MLALEQVRSRSESRLASLHPIVQTAAERLIELSYAAAVPIVITQGLRTIAEQDELYAQGRTKPGAIVTNARGGYSYHNFGVAIDFALLLPDGRTVSWDMARDGENDRQSDWSEVVQIAKRLGFSWGGDWTSFKDYPHLEMTFGLSTADYRTGKKPSTADEAAAIVKINFEEDDIEMTESEKKAFTELQETVQQQGATIQEQTKQLEAQAAQIKVLQDKSSMDAPAWAQPAVAAAVKAKLINTPNGGSYDFYRLLTTMYRAGLIK